jgi:hypothetical protein
MQFFVFENTTGCPSYVIADERTGQAVLVNPQSDFELYIRFADEHRLQLRYIFVPNVSPQLDYATFALRVGGKVYVFDAEEAHRATFNLVRAGDVIEFGKVRLAVQPPEDRGSCMSLLIYDLEVSDRTPQTVLGRGLTSSPLAVPDVATHRKHMEPSGLNCSNG